jgi:hypothetical protein
MTLGDMLSRLLEQGPTLQYKLVMADGTPIRDVTAGHDEDDRGVIWLFVEAKATKPEEPT